LILFALLGYLYGTIIFSFAILLSLCFVSGALIVQQLLLRWLYVNHRRLALKTALEKRAETQQKAMEQEDPGKISIAEEFGEIAEEPELDLASIGQDSRVLLNVFILILALWGLWEIWSNVMPAFSVLDNIILWNNTLIVDGEEKFLPVTLGDFTFALLITFILIIVIQKLPALLEIILLQRLDISQGLRFTIKTLINYSLILVGILWVSNLIGISWAKIQWLVAALSLGIGFGLQEIIANFICGIIILFERPIRIGDVVTIGDTDGVVTRIQIRATTIRNWDRKELLVPNKEFITGRLLNWSLTDRVTRIKFPIGIAYGSDVDLAMKLVEEAAKEHSNVLDEPAPYVSFEEFGDNSLLLFLRCFIEYNDNRVQTITDLHKVIDQKFRDADISISFPQRDIHLDTSTPLEINLRKDT
jgi:potassium efflux system protein